MLLENFLAILLAFYKIHEQKNNPVHLNKLYWVIPK